MHGTDRWCGVGKQASRKSLKPDNGRVKTRSACDNTPTMVDDPKSAEQDDTQRAGESPAFGNVHELSGSGDGAVNTIEIAAMSPLGPSDELPNDKTDFDTKEATPSETIISTIDATSTDEVSLNGKAAELSEFIAIPEEASETDNNATITQATSEDGHNSLMGFDAESAVMVTVPSQSRHEATVDADGATTVESGNTVSSSAIHSPYVPEALPGITAGASPSPLKEVPLQWGRGFAKPTLDSSLTPKRTSPRKKPNLLSTGAVTTPSSARTPKLQISAKSLRTDHPSETPQIGTSLLRRESLRRKESPSKQKYARKSKTPKKKDTLQRRDTLQEREILQRVIAETNADRGNGSLDALPIDTGTFPSSSSAPGAEDRIGDEARSSSEPVLCEEQSDMGLISGAEIVWPAIKEANVEQDLHRAMEAIDVYEHPGVAKASRPLLDVSPDDTEGMEAMDKANEVLAVTELDSVSQAMETTREQTPNQKTRSGARFSDDTSMLKDFLNRAQARKAAQKPALSAPAPDAPISRYSPRRSPRKTHGSQGGRASSPQKTRNIANRPGNPPGKPKTETLESDEEEELSAEPASCRRSTRTRLPAPSKAPPGAPSFIPVRRADGADPVVLQKSQAQEVAVTTRANTRRNKGQSKPPLLALQDLPTESADVASRAKEGAEKAKCVTWAERIASYQDAKGEADEADEKRPKVRRLRGLGAVNGTPAAKRTTTVMSTPNGTPAAKRRGKV